MHSHSIDSFRHGHVFLGEQHRENERRTWIVIAICATMMVAEIVGGLWFGSVALIADGLHMSTHAGALFIAALAYTCARRFARDERFAFGTGKLGDLAAFANALVLGMIALLIAYESIVRFMKPVAISYDEAIAIAIVGLAVNLVSAWLLHDDHAHEHGHVHAHAHDHDDRHVHDHTHVVHADHNMRAAFVHVAADAVVSALVVIGLVVGRQYGWSWTDPAVGMIAAIVILSWSWTLVRSSGAVLLDACPDPRLSRDIAARLEHDGDRLSDLHLWRLGPGHLGAIISLVSDHPHDPEHYKQRLADVPGLSHVTVEVERCPEHALA